MEDSMPVKQAYIRQHIPEDKFEEFYEFCQTEASNMDIDNWSIDFVKDLVRKFIKIQSDRQNINKKKGHQPFFAYQTGNADQLKELRQQIKEEKSTNSESKQSQNTKMPQKQKPKVQQSALELLDSIFGNNSTSNIKEPQFQTRKYDKSFFQSCNFWAVPTDEEKKQSQITPPPTVEAHTKLNNNTKTVQIPNFDQFFQTGMNLGQTKPQNVDKKQEQSNVSIILEGQTKLRESKLVQIPIQDEDIPKIGSLPIKTNSIQTIQKKQNMNQSQMKSEAKSKVKLVSVKNLKTSKVAYTGQVLIKQPFKATVACFKSLQRMNFSSLQLKVSIEGYQTINRSFFSSDYIMYHLRVMPANIICKRNLEDFEKLKSSLEAVYPGIRLPYLEKPGWLQSETTPLFAEKQKRYLTYFLQDILSHPQLRNSRILQDFLTLKDHKSMKRKFQEYEKIKKVSSIEQLCLLEGEVTVQISEQNRQYNQLMANLLTKMNIFWDAQQTILAEINKMYEGLVENYHKWMGAVEDIQKEVKAFNQRVAFKEITSIEKAFEDLSKYIVQCSYFNLNQKQFLQENVLPLARFQKQNMNLLNSIMAIQESLTRVYLKRIEAQKSQDNIDYLSDRLKDFKSSVLEESTSITVLKYQCGYTSQVAVDEGYRYFDRLSQKVVNLISQACKGKLGRLSQSINTITELVNV